MDSVVIGLGLFACLLSCVKRFKRNDYTFACCKPCFAKDTSGADCKYFGVRGLEFCVEGFDQ